MEFAKQLKDLPPDVQTKVLKLHHEVFGESACKTCEGACCSHCGPHRGYLRISEDKFKVLVKGYGFTQAEGFKGTDGCKLPVTERSSVCLSYSCSGLAPEDKGGDLDGPLLKGRGPRVSKPFTEKDDEKTWQMRQLFWMESKPVPILMKAAKRLLKRLSS